MRVLVVVNYYAPYSSGLTNVARDLSEGMAARGHSVKVVTSMHDKSLPKFEKINGVDVYRLYSPLKISKAVLTLNLATRVRAFSRWADVVHIHTPMPESGLVAAMALCPVVITYNCDAYIGRGLMARLTGKLLDVSHRMAFRRAQTVYFLNEDYARHSRIFSHVQDRWDIQTPTCHRRPRGNATLRMTPGMHVGFLGRIVSEKGIPELIRAFRTVGDPHARLLIAGDYLNVAGGSVIEEVRREVGGDNRIHILGKLSDEQLSDFYASIDVFCLPSNESLEAFGIVQGEALLAGVPIVSNDRPGVRYLAQKTGLGLVVDVNNTEALAKALFTAAAMKPRVILSQKELENSLGSDNIVDQYERNLQKIVENAPPRLGN